MGADDHDPRLAFCETSTTEAHMALQEPYQVLWDLPAAAAQDGTRMAVCWLSHPAFPLPNPTPPRPASRFPSPMY